MTSGSAAVDSYLAELDHPLKDGVVTLRAAILSADDAITEHIKWNAPSFCYAGQDRITFRLRPGDRLQLIFHRGAKVRSDAADFVFADPSGLLTWLSPDRGMIDFEDLDAVEAHKATVIGLVQRWVRA